MSAIATATPGLELEDVQVPCMSCPVEFLASISEAEGMVDAEPDARDDEVRLAVPPGARLDAWWHLLLPAARIELLNTIAGAMRAARCGEATSDFDCARVRITYADCFSPCGTTVDSPPVKSQSAAASKAIYDPFSDAELTALLDEL